MCPNKVSKILNVSTPLALFVYFDRKWLTCAAHAFFGTKISKLPHICVLIPKVFGSGFGHPHFSLGGGRTTPMGMGVPSHPHSAQI